MEKTNFNKLIFPVFITAISLIGAWISPEDRWIIITLLSLGIAASFLTDIYDELEKKGRRLDNQEIEIRKLNEKLKIHEQLIDIKADIKTLKRQRKNE